MSSKPIQAAAIIALCIGAAIAYGILHDLITAHICVEYFSIGHPRVIASDSPSTLALVWGVIATWWAGLLLGIPLGLAAQAGNTAPLPLREVGRLVLRLLCIMGAGAALAGFIEYALATHNVLRLEDVNSNLAQRVPKEKHLAFLAVGAAHLASYAVGFLGGLTLIFIVISRRKRLRRAQ